MTQQICSYVYGNVLYSVCSKRPFIQSDASARPGVEVPDGNNYRSFSATRTWSDTNAPYYDSVPDANLQQMLRVNSPVFRRNVMLAESATSRAHDRFPYSDQ